MSDSPAAAARPGTPTTTAACTSGPSDTTAKFCAMSAAASMRRSKCERRQRDAAMTASYNIVVIGGGGAGLRAAIAIAETDPNLSIAIVSKVYPMRSHTVSAEGGAAGVVGADDSLDEHAYDTVSGGDWLADQDAVEAFVAEAPRELLRLEHWGCPWSRQENGRIAVRAFGGMKKMRTWFAADRTGF